LKTNIKEFDILLDELKEFKTSYKEKKLEELMLLNCQSCNLNLPSSALALGAKGKYRNK
jgi:hypothetical protein